MGDQQTNEGYLRTGAPVSSVGRRVSEEDVQGSPTRSMVQFSGDNAKVPNGNHQNHKSYKEKVIAIARVWNEVKI